MSRSGNCDSKILHILDQVENGLNPFPLVLAETLVGLDNFASLGRLSGSPMLLEVSLLPLYFLHLMPFLLQALDCSILPSPQMWFHEKLSLLAPPQNISRYRAKNCRTRALQPIPEDIRSWLSTFPETQI